jgi:muramoyltetrapeptide carboxypeptidase
MKLLKPPRLMAGDTVGVVAPSLPVLPLQKQYDKGIENLRRYGFKVKEGKTVGLVHMGYMAGKDLQRAHDINAMFADHDVKAIICAFGGEVAIRTLRHLDYSLIRSSPKIFSGMSDITIFHLAFLAKTGLVSLHQTDVLYGFDMDIKSEEAKYEIGLFLKVTQNAEPLGLLPPRSDWEVWREGAAKGRLFGGNMRSIQALLGTPYFPRIDEDILFFWEALAESADRIDQVLAQFREAGLFDRAKGMLIGKIRGEGANARVMDMTREVRPAVLELTEEFGFPIIAGMDFGHYTPNLPLPLGLMASMDTSRIQVRLDESYVG